MPGRPASEISVRSGTPSCAATIPPAASARVAKAIDNLGSDIRKRPRRKYRPAGGWAKGIVPLEVDQGVDPEGRRIERRLDSSRLTVFRFPQVDLVWTLEVHAIRSAQDLHP